MATDTEIVGTAYSFRRMVMKEVPDWEKRRMDSDAFNNFFCHRINGLTAQRAKAINYDTASDIDIAVFLTRKEWNELVTEMRAALES